MGFFYMADVNVFVTELFTHSVHLKMRVVKAVMFL